jgi:hypothetical protein
MFADLEDVDDNVASVWLGEVLEYKNSGQIASRSL